MYLTRRTLLARVPLALIGPGIAAGENALRSFALGEATGDAMIPTILDVVPATARESDTQYGIVIELTDIASELEHTGTVRPASLDEGDPDREAYLDRLTAIASTGGTVVQFALAPEWRDLHGFDILDVDQIASYGVPPDRVIVLQGRFDRDEIRAALTDQGYEANDVDGVTVMALEDGDPLGLDNPVNRIWVGSARNVALIDDGRLAFSASTALVEEVIQTSAGDEESLNSDDDMLALFPMTAEPFTSGVVVDGRGLAADRFPNSEEDGGPSLPRVHLTVFGATPGALSLPSEDGRESEANYPIGENQVRVLFADGDAAATGREAIESRLATGSSVHLREAWSDLFGEIAVEQVNDSALVIVHLPKWMPGQRRVTDLVYMGDMGFLLWK